MSFTKLLFVFLGINFYFLFSLFFFSFVANMDHPDSDESNMATTITYNLIGKADENKLLKI